ncbi:hypothetical protein LEMLEM_LOCUS74 [Lemmus lemmus]|jgi:cold shock protein
MLGSH